MNLLSLLFPPRPKKEKLPENDLFQITSKEVLDNMIIMYGTCRKKLSESDLPSLTKMFEKSHKCAVSLSINPEDCHKLKAEFFKGEKS